LLAGVGQELVGMEEESEVDAFQTSPLGDVAQLAHDVYHLLHPVLQILGVHVGNFVPLFGHVVVFEAVDDLVDMRIESFPFFEELPGNKYVVLHQLGQGYCSVEFIVHEFQQEIFKLAIACECFVEGFPLLIEFSINVLETLSVIFTGGQFDV